MQPNKIKSVMQYLKSWIAFFLALTTGFYGDFGFASVSPSTPVLSPPSINLLDVTLPKELGDIKETFKGQNSDVIFIIQDAHAIPDAQRKIQKIIDHFQKEYRVGLVALEGAHSTLDAQMFKSFPDKEKLGKVFGGYFDRGELSGGTAAAIFNTSPSVYEGIENWGLYEAGLEHFLAAMAFKNEVTSQLALLFDALQIEKQKNYSAEMLSIDQALRSFHQNAAELMPVLEKLAAAKAPDAGSELALLLEEMGRSQEADVSVELEVKRIADSVRNKLRDKTDLMTQADLAELNAHFQEYQTSNIPAQAFALFLKGLVIKHKIRIRVSKRLNALVGRQRRMKDIEGTQLFDEFERYTKTVKTALLRGPAERALDARNHLLELTERLAELKLSRDDWNQLKALLAEMSAWDISPDGIDRQGDAARLLRQMNPHLDFYRNAENRDQSLMTQTEALLKKYGAKSAALVAGGFHAEGLTYRLKAKGISYALIMPAIKNIPDETNYLDQMQGGVTWGDYFEVKDGKVNLHEAFVRGTRDRLLNSHKTQDTSHRRGESDSQSTIHDPRLLKNWRDQMIRDLAAQGRITESASYTCFIDEVVEAEGQTRKGSPLVPRPSSFHLTQQWRANVDHFISGLRHLHETNQMTEYNIMNLVRPATIAALLTSPQAQLGSADVSVELIPKLVEPGGKAEGRKRKPLHDTGHMTQESGPQASPFSPIVPRPASTVAARSEVRAHDFSELSRPDFSDVNWVNQYNETLAELQRQVPRIDGFYFSEDGALQAVPAALPKGLPPWNVNQQKGETIHRLMKVQDGESVDLYTLGYVPIPHEKDETGAWVPAIYQVHSDGEPVRMSLKEIEQTMGLRPVLAEGKTVSITGFVRRSGGQTARVLTLPGKFELYFNQASGKVLRTFAELEAVDPAITRSITVPHEDTAQYRDALTEKLKQAGKIEVKISPALEFKGVGTLYSSFQHGKNEALDNHWVMIRGFGKFFEGFGMAGHEEQKAMARQDELYAADARVINDLVLTASLLSHERRPAGREDSLISARMVLGRDLFRLKENSNFRVSGTQDPNAYLEHLAERLGVVAGTLERTGYFMSPGGNGADNYALSGAIADAGTLAPAAQRADERPFEEAIWGVFAPIVVGFRSKTNTNAKLPENYRPLFQTAYLQARQLPVVPPAKKSEVRVKPSHDTGHMTQEGGATVSALPSIAPRPSFSDSRPSSLAAARSEVRISVVGDLSKKPAAARARIDQIRQTSGILEPTEAPGSKNDIVRVVEDLARQVLRAQNLPADEYTLVIEDSDELNARVYSSEDERIVVFNWGLLKYLRDTVDETGENLLDYDTIAFILGHEGGHSVSTDRSKEDPSKRHNNLSEEYWADEQGLFVTEAIGRGPIGGLRFLRSLGKLDKTVRVAITHPQTHRREFKVFNDIRNNYWSKLDESPEKIPSQTLNRPRSARFEFDSALYGALSIERVLDLIDRASSPHDLLKLVHRLDLLISYETALDQLDHPTGTGIKIPSQYVGTEMIDGVVRDAKSDKEAHHDYFYTYRQSKEVAALLKSRGVEASRFFREDQIERVQAFADEAGLKVEDILLAVIASKIHSAALNKVPREGENKDRLSPYAEHRPVTMTESSEGVRGFDALEANAFWQAKSRIYRQRYAGVRARIAQKITDFGWIAGLEALSGRDRQQVLGHLFLAGLDYLEIDDLAPEGTAKDDLDVLKALQWDDPAAALEVFLTTFRDYENDYLQHHAEEGSPNEKMLELDASYAQRRLSYLHRLIERLANQVIEPNVTNDEPLIRLYELWASHRRVMPKVIEEYKDQGRNRVRRVSPRYGEAFLIKVLNHQKSFEDFLKVLNRLQGLIPRGTDLTAVVHPWLDSSENLSELLQRYDQMMSSPVLRESAILAAPQLAQVSSNLRSQGKARPDDPDPDGVVRAVEQILSKNDVAYQTDNFPAEFHHALSEDFAKLIAAVRVYETGKGYDEASTQRMRELLIEFYLKFNQGRSYLAVIETTRLGQQTRRPPRVTSELHNDDPLALAVGSSFSDVEDAERLNFLIDRGVPLTGLMLAPVLSGEAREAVYRHILEQEAIFLKNGMTQEHFNLMVSIIAWDWFQPKSFEGKLSDLASFAGRLRPSWVNAVNFQDRIAPKTKADRRSGSMKDSDVQQKAQAWYRGLDDADSETLAVFAAAFGVEDRVTIPSLTWTAFEQFEKQGGSDAKTAREKYEPLWSERGEGRGRTATDELGRLFVQGQLARNPQASLEDKIAIVTRFMPAASLSRNKLLVELIGAPYSTPPAEFEILFDQHLLYESLVQDILAKRTLVAKKTEFEAAHPGETWLKTYQAIETMIHPYFRKGSRMAQELFNQWLQEASVTLHQLSEHQTVGGLETIASDRKKSRTHAILERMVDDLEAKPAYFKAQLFRWLIGLGGDRVPVLALYYETELKVNLDDLADFFALATEQERYAFLTTLFIGPAGILGDEEVKNALLADLFKAGLGQDPKDDPALWLVVQRVFEKSPESKRLDLIHGIFNEFLNQKTEGESQGREAMIRQFLASFGLVGVKLGQVIGVEGLSDKAPPLDKRYLLNALRREDPTLESFDPIESIEALKGSGSIGQTYLIKMKDGSERIIKFIRPLAHAEIEENLRILNEVVTSLYEDIPGLKETVSPVLLAELGASVRRELEVANEIENQTTIGNFASGTELNGWILSAPKVDEELKGEQFFAQELVTGPHPKDALRAEIGDDNFQNAAALAYYGLLRQMLILGRFHGDWNRGNVMFDPANRQVHLIDYGNAAQFAEKNQHIFILLIAALHSPTHDGVLGLIQNGLLQQGRIPQALREELKGLAGDRSLSVAEKLKKIKAALEGAHLAVKPQFEIVFKVLDSLDYLKIPSHVKSELFLKVVKERQQSSLSRMFSVTTAKLVAGVMRDRIFAPKGDGPTAARRSEVRVKPSHDTGHMTQEGGTPASALPSIVPRSSSVDAARSEVREDVEDFSSRHIGTSLLEQGNADFRAGKMDEAVLNYYRQWNWLKTATSNNNVGHEVLTQIQNDRSQAKMILMRNLKRAILRKRGLQNDEKATYVFHGYRDTQEVISLGITAHDSAAGYRGGTGFYTTSFPAYALGYAEIRPGVLAPNQAPKEANENAAVLILRIDGVKEADIPTVDIAAFQEEYSPGPYSSRLKSRWPGKSIRVAMEEYINEQIGNAPIYKLVYPGGDMFEGEGDEIVIRNPAILESSQIQILSPSEILSNETLNVMGLTPPRVRSYPDVQVNSASFYREIETVPTISRSETRTHQVIVLSEKSPKHTENQDSLYVNAETGLMVVADGMGGAARGAEASKLAVSVISASEVQAQLRRALTPEDAEVILVKAVQAADIAVRNLATFPVPVVPKGTVYKGPRTTVTVTHIFEDPLTGQRSLVGVKIGDGRVALRKKATGVTTLLTKDDTWVEAQIDKGTLIAASVEAETHKDRHFLTEMLGRERLGDLKIAQYQKLRQGPGAIEPIELEEGDVVLNYDDGIYGNYKQSRINAKLTEIKNFEDAIKGVYDEAMRISRSPASELSDEEKKYQKLDDMTLTGMQVSARREPIVTDAVDIEKYRGAFKEFWTKPSSHDERKVLSSLLTMRDALKQGRGGASTGSLGLGWVFDIFQGFSVALYKPDQLEIVIKVLERVMGEAPEDESAKARSEMRLKTWMEQRADQLFSEILNVGDADVSTESYPTWHAFESSRGRIGSRLSHLGHTAVQSLLLEAVAERIENYPFSEKARGDYSQERLFLIAIDNFRRVVAGRRRPKNYDDMEQIAVVHRALANWQPIAEAVQRRQNRILEGLNRADPEARRFLTAWLNEYFQLQYQRVNLGELESLSAKFRYQDGVVTLFPITKQTVWAMGASLMFSILAPVLGEYFGLHPLAKFVALSSLALALWSLSNIIWGWVWYLRTLRFFGKNRDVSGFHVGVNGNNRVGRFRTAQLSLPFSFYPGPGKRVLVHEKEHALFFLGVDSIDLIKAPGLVNEKLLERILDEANAILSAYTPQQSLTQKKWNRFQKVMMSEHYMGSYLSSLARHMRIYKGFEEWNGNQKRGEALRALEIVRDMFNALQGDLQRQDKMRIHLQRAVNARVSLDEFIQRFTRRSGESDRDYGDRLRVEVESSAALFRENYNAVRQTNLERMDREVDALAAEKSRLQVGKASGALDATRLGNIEVQSQFTQRMRERLSSRTFPLFSNSHVPEMRARSEVRTGSTIVELDTGYTIENQGQGWFISNEDNAALMSALPEKKDNGGGYIGLGNFQHLDIALHQGAEAIVLVEFEQETYQKIVDFIRMIEKTERFEDMLPAFLDFEKGAAADRVREIISPEGAEYGAWRTRVPLRWAKDRESFKRLKQLIREGAVAVAHADISDPSSVKAVGEFFRQRNVKVGTVNLSNAENHIYAGKKQAGLEELIKSLEVAGVDSETQLIAAVSTDNESYARILDADKTNHFKLLVPSQAPIRESKYGRNWGWLWIQRTLADLVDEHYNAGEYLMDAANRARRRQQAQLHRSEVRTKESLAKKPDGLPSIVDRSASIDSSTLHSLSKAIVAVLEPGSKIGLKRSEARRILDFSRKDFPAVIEAVEKAFGIVSEAQGQESGRDHLGATWRLAKLVIGAASKNAKASHGEITGAIHFDRADGFKSFFDVLFDAIAESDQHAEIISNDRSYDFMSQSMNRDLAKFISLRKIKKRDWAGEVQTLNEIRAGLVVALDNPEAAGGLNEIFQGVLFQNEVTHDADQTYANQALFAALYFRFMAFMNADTTQQGLQERLNAESDGKKKVGVRAEYLRKTFAAQLDRELGAEYPGIGDSITQAAGVLTFLGTKLASLIADEQTRAEAAHAA